MGNKRALSIAAVLLFCGSLAARAAAPAKPPAAKEAKEQTFFDSIDVSVVSLDVIVTDKSGKAVPGLTAGDFTVTEDGQPVEITNFYAEAGTDVADTASPVAAAKAAKVPPDQRLDLAIFIDNRNIMPPARNRVIASIKKFLAAHPLSPADRVLVASYDGTVEMRQQPTGDGAVLAAVLDSATKGSSRGVERMVDQRQMLAELQQADLPPDPNAPDFSAEKQDSSAMQASELWDNIRSYAEKRL
ncbi:MAG TPA: VWA domain-containing protein, partial [Thermoanaerobaculia bacterium]